MSELVRKNKKSLVIVLTCVETVDFHSLKVMIVKLVCFQLCLFVCSKCLKNGQAITPPIGFITWQRYRCITDCSKYPNDCISENLIKRIAKVMVSDGYVDAGYNLMIIDDCWSEMKRGKDQEIVPDHSRFPNGMKSLAQYLNSLGIKFGIYADIGTKTCMSYPGMSGHMEQDIKLYDSYGAVYIKVDGCFINGSLIPTEYMKLSKYLLKNYPNITYSCSWPAYTDLTGKYDYQLVAEHCNLWRSYDDIEDSANSFWKILDHYEQFNYSYIFSGPGAWNDADMLLVGGFGLSYDTQSVQMAIWCIMPSPLFISADLENIDSRSKKLLLNPIAISINQDKLGKSGRPMPYRNRLNVWCRQLSDGLCFAVVSRREDYPVVDDFPLEFVGIPHNIEVKVLNVFSNVSTTAKGILRLTINPQGVQFIKVFGESGNTFSNACVNLKDKGKQIHIV